MTDATSLLISNAPPQNTDVSSRRQMLQRAGLAPGALTMPAMVRAQSGLKIRIGYWPIAAGLPFYATVELGYFKEAGLNVDVIKFAGAQQIMEGMLADRVDGAYTAIEGALTGVHADRHHHAAGLARSGRGRGPDRRGATAYQASHQSSRNPALRRCPSTHVRNLQRAPLYPDEKQSLEIFQREVRR